jgi:hypothetical protein
LCYTRLVARSCAHVIIFGVSVMVKDFPSASDLRKISNLVVDQLTYIQEKLEYAASKGSKRCDIFSHNLQESCLNERLIHKSNLAKLEKLGYKVEDHGFFYIISWYGEEEE